jgi:hypothetical protein
MSKQDKKKSSLARKKAEKARGGEFSTFNIPDGRSLWKPKAGTHTIDIIPYEVSKRGINKNADPGNLYFELTFWIHRRIGSNEMSYVCPSKMGVGKCPICKELTRMGADPECDSDERKALLPKERQLFWVYDHKEPEKGAQLWEFSYHNFGKLLDSRIRNDDEDGDYDIFYFPDTDGASLRITLEEEKGGEYTYLKTTSIDFKPRKKPLSKELLAQATSLEDLLKIESYEDLSKALFEDDDSKSKSKKSKDDDDDDDDEDDDEDEAPKSKAKGKSKPATKSKSKPKDDDDDDDDDDDEDEESDSEYLLATAKKADAKNKKAITEIKDRAESVGLDADDFATYMKCAKAIIATENEDEDHDDDDEDEDEAPKSKSKSKSSAKSKSKDDDDDDDEDDDDSDDDDDEDEDDDDSDDDDDEDEEKPKSKSKSKPAAKSKSKKSKDDDDDEDDDDEDDDDDSDDDDDEDDDSEDDDDEPKAKSKSKPAAKSKPAGKAKSKKSKDDDDDDLPF